MSPVRLGPLSPAGATDHGRPKGARNGGWHALVRAGWPVAGVLFLSPCGGEDRGAGERAAAAVLPEAAPAPLDRCLAATPESEWPLPPAFREVSGLALAPDGRLFLHNDEHGLIGVFDYRAGRVTKAYVLGPATPQDDFEGIAIAGSRLFLSNSAGRLYETALPDPSTPDRSTLRFRATETGLGEECEIEGLAADPAAELLYFGCKNPRRTSLKGSVAIFRWSLATGLVAGPDPIRVPEDVLTAKLGGKRFHASALEIDPATGRLVLLAAAERAFAAVDSTGAVLMTGSLGERHRQAEGLAIHRDGRVIIADEAGRKNGVGTVAVFACR